MERIPPRLLDFTLSERLMVMCLWKNFHLNDI